MNSGIHMLVSAIIKAILFYVLFRVVKSLLAYNDSNSYKNTSKRKNSNPKAKQNSKDSEIIDAEYRVIK